MRNRTPSDVPTLVSGYLDQHLVRVFVLLKQDTVEDVLKVEERLALPADQSPGILRCLDVEYFASVLVLLLNGSLETEIIQDGLEECLGVLS